MSFQPPPPLPNPVHLQESIEFKRLFNVSIPSFEILLHDFACAWNKEVLIQGRLYITQHHLAFKGFNKSFILDFTNVIHIEKKSLALVIPNAIEIETESHRYFLASFFNRDDVFDILYRIWSLHVPYNSLYRKYPVVKGLPCTCSSSTSTNQSTCDVCLAQDRLQSRFDKDKVKKDSINELRRSSTIRKSKTVASNSGKAVPHIAPIITNANIPAQCFCSLLEDAKDFKVLMDITLPVPLDTAFEHFYLTNQPLGGWYLQFCKEKKIQDIKIGEWAPSHSPSTIVDMEKVLNSEHPVRLYSLENGHHRAMEYIMPLNGSLGPKSTLCIMDQYIRSMSEGEYICLSTKTDTPMVPSGNCFYSEARVCLTRVDYHSTRIVHSSRVVFTKPSILKGVIIKSSLASQEKFYQDFEFFIKDSLHIPTPKKEIVKESKNPSLERSNSWMFLWVGLLCLIFLQTIVLIRLLGVVGNLERKINGH